MKKKLAQRFHCEDVILDSLFDYRKVIIISYFRLDSRCANDRAGSVESDEI